MQQAWLVPVGMCCFSRGALQLGCFIVSGCDTGLWMKMCPAESSSRSWELLREADLSIENCWQGCAIQLFELCQLCWAQEAILPQEEAPLLPSWDAPRASDKAALDCLSLSFGSRVGLEQILKADSSLRKSSVQQIEFLLPVCLEQGQSFPAASNPYLLAYGWFLHACTQTGWGQCSVSSRTKTYWWLQHWIMVHFVWCLYAFEFSLNLTCVFPSLFHFHFVYHLMW